MIPYSTLKSLLIDYIYGGSVASGSFPELVVELLSTCGCIFLVALPFVVVFRVLKMIMGG